MADLQTLNRLYTEKVKEARAIMAKHPDGLVPEEELTKAQKLLGESDAIKAQIQFQQTLTQSEDFLEEPAGTKAAHLGWREDASGSGGDGEPAYDPKAWRVLEVDHPLIPFRKLSFRYHVPLAVQKKGYVGAFESYVRRGYDRVGPNDRKTMTEAVDTSGGFYAPEDMQTEMLKKIAATAAVRSLARVISTSRDSVSWPRLVYTTDDIYTSGVRLTWTGEIPASSTVHRATEPQAGLLTIPVHTAMASIPFSNDLLEDAYFDVFGFGSDLIGEAFGLGEDDVFLNGDGVIKPMGMVTRITVGTETIGSVVSGAAATLTADGLIDLFYGLPSQYRRNARFLLNSDTAKVARKLKDGNNRYLWDAMQSQIQGSLVSPGDQAVLLGKSVMYDEFMPDVAASAYPILFGDFSGYFIVDRVGLSIQRLSELYAETNITLLLARKRVGGDVAQPWRFRAQQIST